MQTFRVDLKTLLGLVLPNQYCHVIVRKGRGRFSGYITSRIAPTPLMSLIYSTIVLYDEEGEVEHINGPTHPFPTILMHLVHYQKAKGVKAWQILYG